MQTQTKHTSATMKTNSDSGRPTALLSVQHAVRNLFVLAAAALLFGGCASPGDHANQAEPNTGYVDFHADPPDELSWDVAAFDEQSKNFMRLYSELKPPAKGVLRLPLSPGNHRLKVTLLNRVVLEPAVVEVAVKEGMITPVIIKLQAEGTALVHTSTEDLGPTGKGRFGKRTKFTGSESSAYRLLAETQSPVTFQPVARMPYAR